MGHSVWLGLPRADRVADEALRGYQAESCPQCGVHPSGWDPKHGGDLRRPVVVPQWTFCRVCELVAQAQDAGPPPGKDAKGWHLGWTAPDYDKEVTR